MLLQEKEKRIVQIILSGHSKAEISFSIYSRLANNSADAWICHATGKIDNEHQLIGA
ncbi:hypothetical protein [Scytonema sp. PCC 10023]|uniref:hypothetical protein n=1 Tax=Scytonema sp. PCC 10023 TaxID=1680591 RepID=UPI0039C61830